MYWNWWSDLDEGDLKKGAIIVISIILISILIGIGFSL